MRKFRIGKLSLAAFVLIALVAGCGREQTPVLVPSIISTVPANGAVGVPVSQPITATFNQPMSAASINSATFFVTGPGGAAVAGTVTYSGSTATFTPTVFLAPSTLYTATVTNAAKDAAGVVLDKTTVWSFTTGTIPAVVSVNPLNGAVNVPLN